MDVGRFSGEFDARILGMRDADEIFALYRSNPQYFEAMKSSCTKEGVLHDLSALPARKNACDKHYIGFYKGEKLAAVMDLIMGYPTDETAFIGLFMVHDAFHGGGVGSGIIAQAEETLREMGMKYIRLGYVESNLQSRAFWYKNGFRPTGDKSRQEAYSIILMQKTL